MRSNIFRLSCITISLFLSAASRPILRSHSQLVELSARAELNDHALPHQDTHSDDQHVGVLHFALQEQKELHEAFSDAHGRSQICFKEEKDYLKELHTNPATRVSHNSVYRSYHQPCANAAAYHQSQEEAHNKEIKRIKEEIIPNLDHLTDEQVKEALRGCTQDVARLESMTVALRKMTRQQAFLEEATVKRSEGQNPAAGQKRAAALKIQKEIEGLCPLESAAHTVVEPTPVFIHYNPHA